MREGNCIRNNELAADDEEELILDGSELHRYLQSCQNEEIELYCNKNVDLKEAHTFSNCQHSYNLVPKEILEYTNKILHSNLLMEEDAIYLFKLSSELIADRNPFMHSIKWACGVLLLDVISIYCHMRFKLLKGVFIPIIAGSSVVLTSMLNTYLTKSSYERKLKQLIQILQKTFSIVRKTVRGITEDDSLLASKEKILWLSRSNQDIQQEHSFKMKVNEIAIMISKTSRSLKTLISVAQSATFSLMKMNEESSFRNDDYVAYYSDEKLGINGGFDNDEKSCDIAFLHNLKNIYLLMQSECLRLLGIRFCQCNTYKDINDVFKIIFAYINESSSILNLLEKEYEKYFYPSFDKNDICRSKHKNFEETVLIHDMCKVLNGVLIEARRLEEYVNENERSQEVVEFVTSHIIQIEKEFTVTLDTLKRVKEYYLRYSANNKPAAEDQDLIALAKNNSNLTRTNVTVGYSDFSVSGTDEVYLGSSDGIQNIHQEYCDDFNEFKPPNTLIKELKVALVKKREEFEQREIKVLKSADEIEAYKSCSVDLRNKTHAILRKNKEEVSSSICENKTDSIVDGENVLGYIKKDLPFNFSAVACSNKDQPSTDGSKIAGENVISDNLHKALALAASSQSNQWSNMKSVDYFEDEYSD